jgi:hypothetical protein
LLESAFRSAMWRTIAVLVMPDAILSFLRIAIFYLSKTVVRRGPGTAVLFLAAFLPGLARAN